MNHITTKTHIILIALPNLGVTKMRLHRRRTESLIRVISTIYVNCKVNVNCLRNISYRILFSFYSHEESLNNTFKSVIIALIFKFFI